MKNKLLILISLGLFLSVSMEIVSAQPILRDKFYGNVYTHGLEASKGTEIDVWLGGQYFTTHEIGQKGKYTIYINEGTLGDKIEFYIDNIRVGSSMRSGGLNKEKELALEPDNTFSKNVTSGTTLFTVNESKSVNMSLRIRTNQLLNKLGVKIHLYLDSNNVTQEKYKMIKNMNVEVNNSLVSHSILGIHYMDSELGNLFENNLKIHRYNETSENWVGLESTVNSTENYVEANVTHFSTYGLFGREAYCGDGYCNGNEDCSSCSKDCGECPPEENGNNGGTTGGLSVSTCEGDWNCSDWSACKGDIQIRQCIDLNECGTKENKPVGVRECQEPDKICSEGTQVCTEGKLRECTEGHDWEVVKNCTEDCSEDYSKCKEDIKSTTTTTKSEKTTTTTEDSGTTTGQFLTNTTTGILLLAIIAIALTIFILLRKRR